MYEVIIDVMQCLKKISAKEWDLIINHKYHYIDFNNIYNI